MSDLMIKTNTQLLWDFQRSVGFLKFPATKLLDHIKLHRNTHGARRFKRVLREVNGQLMQITDRRAQYYARRQNHDESAALASNYFSGMDLLQVGRCLKSKKFNTTGDNTTSGYY